MALRQQLSFPGLLWNTSRPFSRQCLSRKAGACLGQHITVRTLKHKSKSPRIGPKKRTPVEPGARPRRKAPSTNRGIEQQRPESQPAPEEAQQSRVEAVSSALREGAGNVESGLVAPVHVPDDPQGVLKPDHPAASILTNSAIVVQRQLEVMNVLLNFEQVNKYVIMDPEGNTIGYLAEQNHGMGGTMRRQIFKTHRSFTTHVFDKNEREVLRFHRPFSWINSTISVYDCIGGTETQHTPSDALKGTSTASLVTQTAAQVSQLPLEAMQPIGQASQEWALLRRKYNLFVRRNTGTPDEELQQFSQVDEPFASWDFNLKGPDQSILGSVNRDFSGFAREIFTDTGVYALRMDSASLATSEPQQLQADDAPDTQPAQSQTNANTAANNMNPRAELVATPAAAPAGMTLDQRAVMLATAVSIDFDYFSRSGHGLIGGIPIPIWFPMVGGTAGEVGAAEGAAGAAGGVAGGVGGIATEEGMAGAAAGAGTMAGIEAMRRGQGQGQGQGQVDDASPTANDPWGADGGQGLPPGQGSEDVWGDQMNWGGRDGGQDQDGSDGGSDGGEGGGSSGDFWDSFF